MIIMSVDFGKVRTGLALCDEKEILSFPLEVIEEKDMEVLAEKIKENAKKHKAKLIVLGLPKNMDGSLGESAQRVQKFEQLLNSKTDIPTILWDERRTTVSAHEFLNQTNTRGKKRKSIIDALSASIILESYLNYRSNN